MKIGYSRISTGDQNAALQLDALRAAGAERIFSDTASGANADRPALADLKERLRPNDIVIVWRLDRLARSLKDLIEIATAFEAAGVQLISLTEGIDTTTAAGKLFFHIFGAIAEFERELIRERTFAGLAAARSRGRTGGRKPALSRPDFEAAKKLIAAAGDCLNVAEIGRTLRVSTRTIGRIAAGEYDRHFL